MAQVTYPRLAANPLQRVAVRPSRPAGDDELRHARAAVDDEWQRATPAQLAIRGEQAKVVLAGLDRPDRQHEPRLDAGGQRSGGRTARESLRDDLQPLLERGKRIETQQVLPGRFRGHKYGCGLAERPPQHGSKVESLLPRHLRRADPEREVMDEDRSGRRAWPAERGARPVRIKDGVALQKWLDHGQPARLEHQ